MDFNQFKKEWADAMVYRPADFDFEDTMHELYVEYKEAMKTYAKDYTVKEWCEFFHPECDLDTHPYMLKDKAFNSHHVDSLKQLAGRFNPELLTNQSEE